MHSVGLVLEQPDVVPSRGLFFVGFFLDLFRHVCGVRPLARAAPASACWTKTSTHHAGANCMHQTGRDSGQLLPYRIMEEIARHPAKIHKLTSFLLAAIRRRDLSRCCSDCLFDSHNRIVVRLPRREVHFFTREQATAFGPVNLEVAWLNLVDLDAADVCTDS